MTVTPTYPGIYISEQPSSSRTIVGSSTSVTGFVGYFLRGPADKAMPIFSFGDFQQQFGGIAQSSEASYAISQFFLNGGSEAWVVRTAKSTSTAPFRAASVTLLSAVESGAPVLVANAGSNGAWGNSLYVDIDYNTQNPAVLFNLTVSDLSALQTTGNINTVVSRNLSVDPSNARYAPPTASREMGSLLNVTLPSGGGVSGSVMPAQTGLTGASLTSLTLSGSETMTASIDTTAINNPSGQPYVIGPLPDSTTLASLPYALQAAIRQVPQLASAVVQMIGGQLRVQLTDFGYANNVLTFTGQLATLLNLSGQGVSANCQRYSLGSGTAGAQGSAVSGGDGLQPGATELIGDSVARTGMFALDTVDIINLLSIPSVSLLGATDAFQVMTAATAYCEDRLAFYIADMAASVATPQDAIQWMAQNNITSAYNAVYFPSLIIPDPLTSGTRQASNSGTMAGVYANNDAKRAVWVAPAGIDDKLVGVLAPSYVMTDDENGMLNPLGINCLRNRPVYGNVSWGARTSAGADVMASQWKYIPVRRTALYIEQSLQRGLQWVVFEPNGEVLWSQIRLNVNAFLNNMFVQGAFKGMTPAEAYFVNCGEDTTSEYETERGIVVVEVGFAPLRPAEFVIITLQQLTATSQT